MKKKLRRITAFLLLSAMLFTSTGFENVIAAELKQVEVEETEKNNTTGNTAPDGKESAESTDPSLSEAESNHTAKQSSQDSDSEEITEGKDLKESDDTKKEEPSEKAKSSFQKIKPVVEAEGETGTDLDNFDIRLSWGDPEDNIGDTLTINNEDGSNQEIKLQVTVEYTGTEHYDAEDLSFKLATLQDAQKMDASWHNSGQYEDDIAAELKGSGSGRGDWYYVKEESQEYFSDENKYFNLRKEKLKYTFTNKKEINGSFTSSFQIIMKIKNPEVFYSDIKRQFKTKLFVNGISNEKESNELLLKYQHPTNQTYTFNNDVSPLTGSNAIITKIPDDKTTNDYIFAEILIDLEGKNPEMNHPNCVELRTTFPEDVIVGDVCEEYFWFNSVFANGEYSLLTNNIVTVSARNSVADIGHKRAYFKMAAAFPKSKYQEIEKYVQNIILNVSYLKEDGTYKTYNYDLNFTISFPKIDLPYEGKMVEYNISSSDANYYKERMDYDFSKHPNVCYKKPSMNILFKIIDPGKPYDVVVGSDMAFFYNSKNMSSRFINEDERYVREIVVDKEQYNAEFIEIYGRKKNENEYRLHKKLNENELYELDISEQAFVDVKIIFKNITGSIDTDGLKIYYSYMHDKKIDDINNISNIFSYPYLDVLVDGKNLTDGMLPDTNIQQLKDLIEEYDIQKYGKIKFRNYSYFAVKPNRVSLSGRFDITESIENNFLSFSLKSYVKIMDLLGYHMTKIKCIIEIPDDLVIDNSKLNILQNIKFNQTDNTIIIEADCEENPIFTQSDAYGKYIYSLGYNSSNYGQLFGKLSFNIPLDEFFLKKLNGKDFDIKINTIVDFNDHEPIEWKIVETHKYPNVAKATYQGVAQEVKSNNSNGYQAKEIGVNPAGEYQYKLRLGAGQSKMKYMQFFTNLEQEFGDKAHWNGIFNGTNVSVMEEATGEDIKVYYSDNPAQKHDLSASGWIEDKNWSKELSDVKSVAFNLGNCIIGNGDAAYVLINMLAPADTEKQGLLACNKFTASYKAYDVNEIELDETNYLEDVKDLPSNVTEVRLGDSNKRLVIDVDWQDEDNKYNKRPSYSSYSVVVKQDGNEYQTIKMNSDWYTSLNVPIYKNAFGTKYKYTIEVEDYSDIGYTTEVQKEVKDYGDHFQVTNTLDPDKYILLNLESIWNDNYDKLSQRPNIQSISIKKNVNGTVSNYQTVNTEESKDWKYQIVLPKKDNNENLITYAIEPAAPLPYSTTFTGGLTEAGDYDFTITNELSYEDVMTSIPVVKEWNDDENAYLTRPEFIKVKILQDGQDFTESKITTEDGWKKDIQVPKYKNWDMEEYQYSIEELPVDKYDSQLEYLTEEDGNYKLTFDGQSETEDAYCDYVEIYYNLDSKTYKAGKWGGTDIKGKSVVIPTKDFYVYWKTDYIGDDYWGYAISSVEKTEEEAVSGTQAALPDVTAKNTVSKFDLQSDHSGNYGNNIQELWHYTPEYYLLTNTLDKASVTTEISGVKTWQDEGNIYNTRPEEITVNLMQDGKKLTSTTTNAEKNWKYAFTNIPVFKTDSEKFEYTISEEPVKGYNFEYQKNNLPYKGNVELIFDTQSETESTDYDFVEIYYKQNGQIMKIGPFGGEDSDNKIAGASVVIPTTEFYVYWKTDSSNDSYYGYRVISVNKTDKEATKATAASLPTGVTPVNTKSINDLQSKHGSYGNNVKELWHYTSDLGSDSYSYDLVNTLDTSMLSGNIEITQQVDIVDIIHGNPTFIVEATNGKDTFYKALTFKQAGEQKITMTDLPSGTYTVTVKQPPRYKLTDIKDIENGERSGDSVTLNIQGNTGEATFVSKKTNWKNYSHSDTVINQVHPR